MRIFRGKVEMKDFILNWKILTERENGVGMWVFISEDGFKAEERGVNFEEGGILWQSVDMLAHKGNESGNVDEHAGFFCIVVALVEEFVEVSERGLHVLKIVGVVVVDKVDHGQYENPCRRLVRPNVG